MKTAALVPLLVLACFIPCNPAGAQSDVKAALTVGREFIKTYPFSEPDPVPILARSGLWGRGARLYPYSFFDKLSKEGQDREWTVVRMENPHIALAVLPEVGGKIWGASEKSTGREFIYTNHVLKFREIALRGPWVSGGIEFNFGIVGHTPAGATPVNYLTRENPDGSVSCIVGTLDLPSRTRWSVEIRLAADRACFETRALWYNPSPLHQSYYCWMNGAVRTADDLQYVLPGHQHIAHDFSVPLRPWPVNEEVRDLSWYRNNDFGSYKSYFTVGEYAHFFGGYWHDAGFGFGHYARYDDLPGRKVWIWGLSRQGAIWEGLLTDADGQYTEPQAGRYLNQNDHAFFAPYTADQWRETWFPYKGTGPMTHASPRCAMNVSRDGNTLAVRLCALERIDEHLVVLADGEERFFERVQAQPMEVYGKAVPVPPDAGLLEVKLGNELCYTSDPGADDIRRPLRFHPFDQTTVEGRYLAAERLEKERNHRQALEGYLACIEEEPRHARALCRAAELYARRAEYEKALSHAGRALEIDMYDPQANYVYGVVARRLGMTVDAKETLGWAARSMAYRSAAYCQLAEIHLTEGRPDLALEYGRRALDFNRFNLDAYLVRAVAFRRLEQPEEARKALDRLLEIDPLNHPARFEHFLLHRSEANLERFRSMIRSELPHEHYLEAALFYVRLGLSDEALQVFEMAAEHPVACYWLAYLWRNDPEKSRPWLERARSISPRLVFPFREETIPVLQWATEGAPGCWLEPYYLGLIHWGKGRIEEARKLFADLEPTVFAPFFIARAHLLEEDQPEAARHDLEKAAARERGSWKTTHRLLDFYLRHGLHEEALEGSLDAFDRFPEEDAIRIDRVRALLAAERHEEAAGLLEDVVILPAEGATGVHGLFVECHVHAALQHMGEGDIGEAMEHLERAKTFPENLGTGAPYHPDLRMQDYLLALCFEKQGKTDLAEERKQEIRRFTLDYPDEKKHAYFGGLVLEEYGEQETAKELLKEGRPSEKILEKIRRQRDR